jgi:hypothetical protein
MTTIEALAELTSLLSQPSVTSNHCAAENTLAAALQAQDQELLQAGQKTELAAARGLRERGTRHQANKVLSQALRDIPSDSGPLNPQRLAVDSMVVMGDLSPRYLNRFVAYIDTLLWLEVAGK